MKLTNWTFSVTPHANLTVASWYTAAEVYETKLQRCDDFLKL